MGFEVAPAACDTMRAGIRKNMVPCATDMTFSSKISTAAVLDSMTGRLRNDR